jgi:hypothetical protein
MVTRRQKLLLFGGARLWLITQPASSLLFQIDVRSKVTGQVVTVSWGDGPSNTYTLSSTVDTAISHVYAVAAVYNITIAGATNIVRLTSTYGDGRSNWGADITSWRSLTFLVVSGSNTLTGSVADLTLLTYLDIQGSNTLSGSVASLTSLTFLLITGSNTLTGSVAGLTLLTLLYVQGSNTITGSVTGLLLLTYLDVAGSNTLTGSVAGLTLLTLLTVTGSNTITGSIASLTSLTHLLVTGSNTITGSIASLTSLTYLVVTGSNTITGSIASLTLLTVVYVTGSNTVSGSVAGLTLLTFLLITGGLNTIAWAVGPLTSLATLDASDNALNQAAVDAILLAMYTARATYTNAAPSATLGGTNAAPSGVYADEDPPVTGKGMAYELVVDPEAEGFSKWVISFTP